MTWFETAGYTLAVVYIILAILSKTDHEETKLVLWATFVFVSMIAGRLFYQ